MQYQYRRDQTNILTRDEKLVFLPADLLNRHVMGYDLYVSGGENLTTEESDILFAGNDRVIVRSQLRAYLQAAQELLQSAGYDLDIRCKLHIYWRTTDRQWQLKRSGPHRRWYAWRDGAIAFDGHVGSLTRQNAIEWAIEHEKM